MGKSFRFDPPPKKTTPPPPEDVRLLGNFRGIKGSKLMGVKGSEGELLDFTPKKLPPKDVRLGG